MPERRKEHEGMPDFKNILVPTDFSMPSVEGVRYAARLARDSSAQVILVHVIPNLHPRSMFEAKSVPMFPPPEDARRIAQENLANVKKSELTGVDRVKTVVCEGHAASEIVRTAQEEQVDLIVMGSTGHSALVKVLLGSTAERVTRTATCPVLLVRPKGTVAPTP
jgi:nucleotide-binding universal stress UspA family protein